MKYWEFTANHYDDPEERNIIVIISSPNSYTKQNVLEYICKHKDDSHIQNILYPIYDNMDQKAEKHELNAQLILDMMADNYNGSMYNIFLKETTIIEIK